MSSLSLPNIALVLVDDMNVDDIHVMHRTRRGLNIKFANAFTTTPLCCPSRASFFSGRHQPINNLVRGGCYNDTWIFGSERRTFAVYAKAAGYTTSLAGKYLNKPAQYYASGSDPCEMCEVGLASVMGSASCNFTVSTCPKGTQLYTGIFAGACDKCEAGKFNIVRSETSKCKFCGEGKFFVGQTEACKECPAGKYQDSSRTADAICNVCPDGQYNVFGQGKTKGHPCTKCSGGPPLLPLIQNRFVVLAIQMYP